MLDINKKEYLIATLFLVSLLVFSFWLRKLTLVFAQYGAN